MSLLSKILSDHTLDDSYVETEILKSPALAYEYVKKFPSKANIVSPVIAKSSKYSYLFSVYFLQKRFKDGEKAISKSSKYALKYAKHIKGRLPSAEKILKLNASDSYSYSSIFDKRFLAGEKNIATNSELSFKYSKFIIRGRFKEGEKSILKDASTSLMYSSYLSSRLPKAEKIINNYVIEYSKMNPDFVIKHNLCLNYLHYYSSNIIINYYFFSCLKRNKFIENYIQKFDIEYEYFCNFLFSILKFNHE